MNHGYWFMRKLNLIEIPFQIGSPSNENGAKPFHGSTEVMIFIVYFFANS